MQPTGRNDFASLFSMLAVKSVCADDAAAESLTHTVEPTLGAFEVTTINMLMAYAAKANSTAQDGNSDHSPFTSALLANLFEPGLDIRLAFGRVRDQVLKSTDNRQQPFVYGSLGSGQVALVSSPSQPGAVTDDIEKTKADYTLINKIDTKSAWEVFLSQHPTGFYSDLARQRVATLNSSQPPPSPPSQVASVAVAPPPPASRQPSTEEQRAWDKIKDSSNESDFRDFIKKYPASVLANVARSHIDAIEHAAQAAARAAAQQAEQAADRARLCIGPCKTTPGRRGQTGSSNGPGSGTERQTGISRQDAFVLAELSLAAAGGIGFLRFAAKSLRRSIDGGR